MKANEKCDSAWNVKNVRPKQIKGILFSYYVYVFTTSSAVEQSFNEWVRVLLWIVDCGNRLCCAMLRGLFSSPRPLCGESTVAPPDWLYGLSEWVCRGRGLPQTSPSSVFNLPKRLSPSEHPAYPPDKPRVRCDS